MDNISIQTIRQDVRGWPNLLQRENKGELSNSNFDLQYFAQVSVQWRIIRHFKCTQSHFYLKIRWWRYSDELLAWLIIWLLMSLAMADFVVVKLTSSDIHKTPSYDKKDVVMLLSWTIWHIWLHLNRWCQGMYFTFGNVKWTVIRKVLAKYRRVIHSHILTSLSALTPRPPFSYLTESCAEGGGDWLKTDCSRTL